VKHTTDIFHLRISKSLFRLQLALLVHKKHSSSAFGPQSCDLLRSSKEKAVINPNLNLAIALRSFP
jgi:hypothetical protein